MDNKSKPLQGCVYSSSFVAHLAAIAAIWVRIPIQSMKY